MLPNMPRRNGHDLVRVDGTRSYSINDNLSTIVFSLSMTKPGAIAFNYWGG
ncbi:hypothetical protein ACLOJK_003433, partial [Asimina triloba]